MLLSYKSLHLEAQQRLQEEGCVVNISGRHEGESEGHRAANVTEDPLHESPMGLTRGVHVETHLLNSILKIRSGESQILKSTDDGTVERSIRRWRALKSRNLGLRINRSSNRVTVEHASMLKELVRILLLMKKEAVRLPNNLNAKEIM